MNTRGWQPTITAAGLFVLGSALVACGNQTDGGLPTPGTSVDVSTPTTPSAAVTPDRTVPVVKETPTTPSAAASPDRTVPVVKETPSFAAVQLSSRMLLTGKEVATADPNRGWVETKANSRPICGPASTGGNGANGSLNRQFTTELDASGGHWLTRYASPAATEAAYEQIVTAIRSCKALTPGSTHARKLTENRTLPLGDATTILRWYDYPLPNDLGSEPGGFPYAVTRKGTIVSVLAFREMGKGVAPDHFEALTHTAAAHLG
jgi:hypothetical protein